MHTRMITVTAAGEAIRDAGLDWENVDKANVGRDQDLAFALPVRRCRLRHSGVVQRSRADDGGAHRAKR